MSAGSCQTECGPEAFDDPEVAVVMRPSVAAFVASSIVPFFT